ncbi:glutathione transferase GstA [Paraglaciecola sp.]|uniref:glutathione transferase GstA n=1 Tax=Paraglaciecola sp. TaxID=1920173 RepID=UPI0030F3DDA4
MKLYYKPASCSLASHILLKEIEADFEIESVNTETSITESGSDYTQINPKKYVPALYLREDLIVTEGPAILQYLADLAPDFEMLPAVRSESRAKVIEHLTYTSSELHKAFSPFFNATADEATKAKAKNEVSKKLQYLDGIFSDGRHFLVDNKISIADLYMFVVCNWCNFVGISLEETPHVARFVERIAKRPATQEAMKAEGLL